MAVGQRINEFVKFKRIRQQELADMLELSRGTVNQALLDRANFTTASIGKLIELFPELNARWILIGEGTMTNDGNTSTECEKCETHEQRIADLEQVIEAKDEIIRLLKNPK